MMRLAFVRSTQGGEAWPFRGRLPAPEVRRLERVVPAAAMARVAGRLAQAMAACVPLAKWAATARRALVCATTARACGFAGNRAKGDARVDTSVPPSTPHKAFANAFQTAALAWRAHHQDQEAGEPQAWWVVVDRAELMKVEPEGRRAVAVPRNLLGACRPRSVHKTVIVPQTSGAMSAACVSPMKKVGLWWQMAKRARSMRIANRNCA